MDLAKIISDELKGSFNFFYEYTNLDPNSPGYGLTVDCSQKSNVASIASVGFALTAWVIAADRGYLPRDRALEITQRTLQTLVSSISHHHGFFAHFLKIDTGERYKKCEYSTIDTALCLNGVITASAYFQNDRVDNLARQLLERIDWKYIIFERNGKTLFRMAYNPDKGGDYVTDQPGFIHQWDMAAEQKMMYLQAAPMVDPSVARNLYHGFERHIGYYERQPIIINPGGNLFAYQFTEAWLDTAHYIDPDGVDWFNNTRLAALANRSYCLELAHKYKTFHKNSWGLSAGDSPWGYYVSGGKPTLVEPKSNGTVSIYSTLACLPYIPDLVLEMIQYLIEYQNYTWGQYGFFDAYNLAVIPPWYSTSLYGINKGVSMIMIENYLSGLIWDTYTKSSSIQQSLAILGFTRNQGG